jgi:predicted ATP-dependent serine protease
MADTDVDDEAEAMVDAIDPQHRIGLISISGPVGEAIGPLREGCIVFLAGPAGVGKSMALYQCAVDFESQCEDVLFFSFEETEAAVESRLRDFGARGFTHGVGTIQVVSCADMVDAEEYVAKFPVRRILVDGLSYHRRADITRVLDQWKDAGAIVIAAFHTSKTGGIVSRYRHISDVTVDIEHLAETGTTLFHRHKSRFSPVTTVAASLTKLGFARPSWTLPAMKKPRTRAALEDEIRRLRALLAGGAKGTS